MFLEKSWYIVSLLQKCYSAIGMNFAQPLRMQHASKIYTSSAIESTTVLFSTDYSHSRLHH